MSFQFSYSFHQSHLKVLSSSGQSAGRLEYLWSTKSRKPCKHLSSLKHPRQDLLEVESIFEAPDPSADAAPPRLFHKALECRECGLLHGVSYSIRSSCTGRLCFYGCEQKSNSDRSLGFLALCWQSCVSKIIKAWRHGRCKGASGAAPVAVGDGSVDQMPCREHDAQSKGRVQQCSTVVLREFLESMPEKIDRM